MSIGATEESRQVVGILTFNTDEDVPVQLGSFEKQAHTVELAPAVRSEGDRLELLNGNSLLPEEFTDWTLNVGIVQDFNDPQGILELCRSRAGQIIGFTWEPNDEGPSFAGTIKVRAGRYGGPVRVRLTTDLSFPVQELADPMYPEPAP